MRQNLTIAVVGAGKWGKNLIKNFFELGVLAAIVEADINKQQALIANYPVKFFTDIAQVLATTVTAVAIATPVFCHFDLAKKALLAKKDVFVEKPMTTTVDQAQELIDLAKLNQCVLMVGHLLLYQPAISFIKNFLAEQNLGKIYSLHQIRRSLGTIRTQENVLYSLGVHDLAVLHYLVAEEIVGITANAQVVMTDGIADDMAIHLRYTSGVQAHIHLNWLWPVKDRHLMILAEKGALLFDEIRQQVIFYNNFGNKKDHSVVNNGETLLLNDTTAPLKLELEHFLDCITYRRQPLSDGEQGKAVVQLMANIMQAQEKIHDPSVLYS